VLLYHKKVKGKPIKIETTWLGPYIIEDIRVNGIVWLKTLQRKLHKKIVNGALTQTVPPLIHQD
jgi:hypothetical protein